MSKLTEQIKTAKTVHGMADAFHPSELSRTSFHRSSLVDAIEAALMFGAGRVPASDFISAVEDCPALMDAIADELHRAVVPTGG